VEVVSHGAQSALLRSDGGEIDLVSFAARDRAHSIRWFDPFRRGSRAQLRSFVTELEERLLKDQESPLELSRAASELALDAMRWVVENDDFDPENITGEIRAIVAQVEAKRAA
jgi:hypothetical protein